MNTNIYGDFQIYISAPLTNKLRQIYSSESIHDVACVVKYGIQVTKNNTQLVNNLIKININVQLV